MNGTIIIAKQNRLMRQFSQAGAISAASSLTLEQMGCRDSWIFRRLVARGVIRAMPDGRFYLDQDAAEAFRSRRRRVALLVLGITALCLLIVFAQRL